MQHVDIVPERRLRMPVFERCDDLMGSILTAVAGLAGVGGGLGILLAGAARLLTVKNDERGEKII